jgi:hypothetical protein
MSRRRDGDPIGPKKTITAAEQAAALGMQPGSAPKEGAAVALTPTQARKLMSDQWPGEAPDIGWETITVPAGRDVAAALGVDLATLPVGVEAELGPPQPRPERRPHVERESSSPTSSPPADDAVARAKLASDFRAHAKKVAALAESAKQSGDAAREAKAAAEVAASRQVGEALRARGIL